jgi:Asp-tRNA(Asn)/Glu-tRNA(Gln) amidotransferase A subunit family amidase
MGNHSRAGGRLSGPVGVSLMSAPGTDKALLALARELTE